MKLLIFSDAHLDASTAGMRRIDDLANAFHKITILAATREVDAVAFLGDLADPDCGSILVRVLDVALQMVFKLKQQGIVSFWNAGNHDTIEDGSGFTTLAPLRRAHGCVFERPGVTEFLGCHIGFLPYPARISQYDPAAAVDGFFTHARGKRIILGHCTAVPGAKAGSESGDLARGGTLLFPLEACKKAKVDFMANGHFHHQQITPDGIHIPGSLEKLRFDEEHNTPGIFIVDI